jgi:putative ABC transport system permease protein
MAQTASFREAAEVALDSLRSSKLRSFLTLLGIILATATLIAVMSIIHGMDVYIASHISNMGADGFRVVRMAFIGAFDPRKFVAMDKKNPELTVEEFEALKSQVTLVREFGMQASRSANAFYAGESMTGITLNGGSANWGGC